MLVCPSERLYVCPSETFLGKLIVLAPVQDKCINLFIKILPTKKHLIYNYFVRMSGIKSYATFERTHPHFLRNLKYNIVITCVLSISKKKW